VKLRRKPLRFFEAHSPSWNTSAELPYHGLFIELTAVLCFFNGLKVLVSREVRHSTAIFS
jgi:hypothetical protein